MPYCSNQNRPQTPIAAVRNNAFADVALRTAKETGSSVNKTFSQHRNNNSASTCGPSVKNNLQSRFLYIKKFSDEVKSNSKVAQIDRRGGEKVTPSAANSYQEKRSPQVFHSQVHKESEVSESLKANSNAMQAQRNAENLEISNNRITKYNFPKNRQSNSYPHKSNGVTPQQPHFHPHQGASYRHQRPHKKTYNNSGSAFGTEKSVMSYKIPQKNDGDDNEEKNIRKPGDSSEANDVNMSSARSGKISKILPGADVLQDVKYPSNSSVKVLGSSATDSPFDKESYPSLGSVYKSANFSTVASNQYQKKGDGHSTEENKSSNDNAVWDLSPKPVMSFSDILKMAPKVNVFFFI